MINKDVLRALVLLSLEVMEKGFLYVCFNFTFEIISYRFSDFQELEQLILDASACLYPFFCASGIRSILISLGLKKSLN